MALSCGVDSKVVSGLGVALSGACPGGCCCCGCCCCCWRPRCPEPRLPKVKGQPHPSRLTHSQRESPEIIPPLSFTPLQYSPSFSRTLHPPPIYPPFTTPSRSRPGRFLLLSSAAQVGLRCCPRLPRPAERKNSQPLGHLRPANNEPHHHLSPS